MDKYVKNVPPGYYSDESSDDGDFIYDSLEIHIQIKKHCKALYQKWEHSVQSSILFLIAGQIPDIGYRAGINGLHFNIKLDAETQLIYDELSNMWHGNSNDDLAKIFGTFK